MKILQDKITACLLAGGLGDALGYTVEFMSYAAIKETFGKSGIREPHTNLGKSRFSDDTQMTLFTLEGLIKAIESKSDDINGYIYSAYLNWLRTQNVTPPDTAPYAYDSFLQKLTDLNHRRAPGNTCITALRSGRMGMIFPPINNSKGCGGVMRTAPLGFIGNPLTVLKRGAEAAAITHGHPLGWLPAGMLSDIVNRCLYGAKKPLKTIVLEALDDVMCEYRNFSERNDLKSLIMIAIELSETDTPDVNAIFKLGEGWVGEEALAIAVYCCLKHPDNIKEALRSAVNHSGDSDSTGAIAGNILGAYLGMDAVPVDWLEVLEIEDVIREEADTLVNCINTI